MKRRLALALLLSVVAILLLPTMASAHGEKSQEAFFRQKTVAFFDVKFSTDRVKQGEPVTITGTFKILETWPTSLKEPKIAYVGVTAPGPVMVMKERTVNGEPTPGSIYIQKGGVYEFKMTLEGRRPGQWHIHPIVAIDGSGSLLGPGQWITVEAAPGGFQFPIKLWNGATIDLERYQTWFIVGWLTISVVLGLWWMWYWTGPKRTVTRLAVTSQLPLNDDGAAVGLITPQDHRFVNLVAALSVILLVGGTAYVAYAYPVRLPQQVIRFEPQPLPLPKQFVEGRALQAVYDPDTHTLTFEVEIQNKGDKPVSVVNFTTSNLTFVPGKPAAPWERKLVVEPSGPVGPGETRRLKLRMSDPVWREERMIPVGQPQMAMAGVVTVADANGVRNFVTVEGKLVLTRFFEY